MFDGNFRSRREVNLGSSTGRRSGTTTGTTGSSSGHPGSYGRNPDGSRGRNKSYSTRLTNPNNNNNNNKSPTLTLSSSGQMGKQELLKHAEEQRRIRQEQNRRDRACRLIQRMIRGWTARRWMVQSYLPSLFMTTTAIATSKASLSAILSMRLSPCLQRLIIQNDMNHVTQQLLCQYSQQYIQQQQQQLQQNHPPTDSIWFSRKRIVQNTLQFLRPPSHVLDRNEEDVTTRTALFDILQSYFTKSTTTLSTTTTSLNTTDNSSNHGNGRDKWDSALYTELIDCARAWWIKAYETWTTAAVKDSNIAPSITLLAVTTKALLQWSFEMAQVLSDRLTQTPAVPWALLSSVFLGTPDLFRSTQTFQQLRLLLPMAFQTSEDYYTAWFLPLASVFETNTTTTTTTTITDNLLQDKEATRLHQETLSYVMGREVIVLSNALDLCAGTAATTTTATTTSTNHQPRQQAFGLIHLMHHFLTERTDLAILASLVVRGEDLKALYRTSLTANEDVAMISAANEDDDSSDSDDEQDTMDGQTTFTTATNPADARPTKYHRRTAGSRYSRQELLTMVKLDKLYQDQVQKSRKECLTNLARLDRQQADQVIALAQKIGTTAKFTWLQWGMTLLDPRQHSSTDPSFIKTRDAYLALLGILLQSSSGLRVDSKLVALSTTPFLSQLSFDRLFLEQLWDFVQWRRINDDQSMNTNYDIQSTSTQQDTVSPTIMAVFCDLFGHWLNTLTDDEFIYNHDKAGWNVAGAAVTQTTASATAASLPSSIVARNVIEFFKQVLYELYWTKPVLAQDIAMNNGRGRLILAGTKLWNALYERWNRLLGSNYAICDASTWWFPYLSSREGDGALVSAREAQQLDDDDDDAMNDDGAGNHRQNDDVDDPMELEAHEMNGPSRLSSADAETDALADSFRDPKMARILTCIPQALPFERRVRLFHSLLRKDKLKSQDETAEYRRAMLAMMRRDEEELSFDGIREQVRIRRRHLYADSMQQLNEMGPRLKRKVQVSFINEHGVQEAGIDGGGVFKEFLDDLIKDGFAANATEDSSHVGAPRLFTVTPSQTLAVNADMMQDRSMLEHYEFLGRVLGKAVYESILVEPQFCLPFLNQLLGKRNSLEDLKNIDEEYYRNLTRLRDCDEATIESMGLNFEITIGSYDPVRGRRPRSVELIPGGRNIAVTKQNVVQYIYLVAHQRINVQGAEQTRAFLRGFRTLIPASWVRLFSAKELQKLISGDDAGIDVDSLKRAMQYAAGYHPTQPIIQAFWEIIEEFTPDQQRKFLKFMTSCSRQPLLGFASLEPAPCIQQIRLPDEELNRNSRLPTSSTCMNLLKLPNYKDKELMRQKLLAAIEAGAGFELT